MLGDVYEEYSPFRTVANGGTEGRKRRRRTKAGSEGAGPQTLADSDITTSAQTVEPSGTGGRGYSESRGKLTRHLKQLFIRGDNIVMVAPLGVKGQASTEANYKGQSSNT